jgi:hypothetical protein
VEYPSEYGELIKFRSRYRSTTGVEFLRPDSPWSRKTVTFTSWFEAYNYAIFQEETFAAVRRVRVIGV